MHVVSSHVYLFKIIRFYCHGPNFTWCWVKMFREVRQYVICSNISEAIDFRKTRTPCCAFIDEKSLAPVIGLRFPRCTKPPGCRFLLRCFCCVVMRCVVVVCDCLRKLCHRVQLKSREKAIEGLLSAGGKKTRRNFVDVLSCGYLG